MTIDWHFIGTLEGRKLTGYIPAENTSRSGVTVATGVDIGNMTGSTFLKLPHDLQDKLHSYLGLIGQRAVSVLSAFPLTITEEEADTLDSFAAEAILSPLRHMYTQQTGIPFSELPDAVQTVMASVAYQYGSIWVRCPHFWRACVARDWHEAYDELKKFGDGYQPRHDLEAAYLQSHLIPQLTQM